MLLILTEPFPGTGMFSLHNVFLLASLTCSKNEVLFAFEKGTDFTSLFRGRGFRYVEHTETRRLFKEGITAVLFFKDILSGNDKKILSRAKKKGIPAAKVSYMGENLSGCDLIIDPSTHDYSTTEAGGKILSGPGYGILHNKFIHFHHLKRKYNRELRNILIAAGDHFPYRELRTLAETLINNGYRVKLVPGKNFRRFNRKTLKRLYPSLQISGTPESHARSFFETDLAVIDPEFSAAEAAATGTPAIFIPQNNIGESTALYYEEEGTGLVFRRRKKTGYSEILELLKFFTRENREKMGAAGKSLVDGRGVYRIAEALKSLIYN